MEGATRCLRKSEHSLEERVVYMVTAGLLLSKGLRGIAPTAD
jgi:hypothetical protein